MKLIGFLKQQIVYKTIAIKGKFKIIEENVLLIQVQWHRKGIDTPAGFLFSLTMASLIMGNFWWTFFHI